MTRKIGEDGIPFIPSEEFATLGMDELDALRRETPVVRTHPMRVIALRAAQVTALAADPRLVQMPGALFAQTVGIPEGRVTRFLHNFMLMTNGPEHATRRGAFARSFAHPVIRSKRTQVRAVADRVIADLPRGEAFDFLALCASRLPAEMVAEVLGLPVEESAWFAGKVYAFSRCLMVPYAIDRHAETEAAAEALHGFVTDTLNARRAAPGDDLLSLLATDDSARALDAEDLVYQVMGVILAGSDTTRSGFNLVVGRLLGERALWDEVMADRALIPAAVEEGLRLEPPVGSMPRLVPAPVEVGGVTVPGGQMLALANVTAMRDETALEDPLRFDLHRTDRQVPHPVFGGGAHRCLGEMLARIEMEEGLAALMDAAPGIEMIEAPRVMGISGIRPSTPMIVRIP